MGIKFECPNGHKLHVKSFLAGKKGLCPDCGVKLVIPGGTGEQDDPSSPETGGTTAIGSTASIAPPPPIVEPEPRKEVQQVQQEPVGGSCWFVRLPTGDQYGPATDEVFHSWVQQGRVGSDALVWKEGWSDWRRAADVIVGNARQGVTVAPPPPLDIPTPHSPPPTPPTPNGELSTIANSSPRANTQAAEGVIKIETDRAAPRSTSRTPIVVILLCLVCVMLLVPLVYLLVGSG